jgi:hypothetical protein
MADGTTKPIADVQVGDMVQATDPATGKTEARPVVALIRHSGEHTLVDITLVDGTVLTATDHHLIWDATTNQFTDAIDLHAHDSLLGAHGRALSIASTRVYPRDLTAYNLQIDGIHTYYAGTTPILVHNSCLTSSVSKLANKFGVNAKQIKTAIHAVKRGGGFDNNPDVLVSLENGEVYVKLADGSAGDAIGNIFDHLGLYG